MYRREDREYYRVTGVLSGLECEAVAFNISRKTSEAIVVNAVTLPGSLMHWKIEDFLSKQKGIGPADPIYWSEGAQMLLDDWKQSGELRERFTIPANEGFEGFMKFYRYDHYMDDNGNQRSWIDPVLIEQTMFCENFLDTGMNVAGTVDLIARVWLKGEVEDDGLFHQCRHKRPNDPQCMCTHQWVVTVMDWKFSVKKQPSHPEQLSTYRTMSEITGYMDMVTENGKYPKNYENWSLLFKPDTDGKTTFRLNPYPTDIAPFLEGLEILKNPRNTTVSRRSYRGGLHGRCMFCAYPNNCPDRKTINQNQTVEVTLEEKSELKYGIDA